MNVFSDALQKLKSRPGIVLYPLIYSLLNYAVMREVLPTLKGVGENAFSTNHILAILSITVVSYLYRIAYVSLLLDYVKTGELKYNIQKHIDLLSSFKLLILDIIVSMVAIIGALMLVIPGILWITAVMLYPVVLVANKDKSISELLKDALRVSKGFRWNILFILVLVVIVNFVAMSVHYTIASLLDAVMSSFMFLSFVNMYVASSKKKVDEDKIS